MTKKYLSLICILALAIAALSLLVLSRNFNEDCLRSFIAWSAKIAAALFSLAFMASSLHYFIKNSWTARLVSRRPMIGLSFAVFHTAHLIFLFILQKQFHPVFDLAANISLFGGGMAYVFMYAMTLTTFPEISKKLTKRMWNTLHLVGGWWIWFIFFRSYSKNVLKGGDEYVMFGLLSLVLILRLAYFTHSRISKA